MEEAAEEGVRFATEGIDEDEVEAEFGGESAVFAVFGGVGLDPTEGFFGVGVGDVAAIGGIDEGEFGEEKGDVGGGTEGGVFFGEKINGFDSRLLFELEAL